MAAGVKVKLPMFLFDFVLDALFGDKAKLVKPFYPSSEFRSRSSSRVQHTALTTRVQ